MSLPLPIFIGYFPKKTELPDVYRAAGIKEICSVSRCISTDPPDWINSWKHNDWFMFDTEQLAWEACDDRALYDMYAYKLFPAIFTETIEPLEIVSSAREALADYEFLGYDPVSRSTDAEFECSPLSCNHGYQKYKVNGHCLLDNFEEAWSITTEIARDAVSNKDWEPGPYFLCAVFRKVN